MADILPLIIIIGVLSLISSAAKKKTAQTTRNFQRPAIPPQTPPQPAPVQENRVAEQTSIFDIPQPVMGVEGGDDCHDYMLSPIDTELVPDESTDSMQNAQAQELLRGVIMSEILTRPVRRYGRRA